MAGHSAHFIQKKNSAILDTVCSVYSRKSYWINGSTNSICYYWDKLLVVHSGRKWLYTLYDRSIFDRKIFVYLLWTLTQAHIARKSFHYKLLFSFSFFEFRLLFFPLLWWCLLISRSDNFHSCPRFVFTRITSPTIYNTSAPTTLCMLLRANEPWRNDKYFYTWNYILGQNIE